MRGRLKKVEVLERKPARVFAQGVFIRTDSEGKTAAQKMQSDYLSPKTHMELFGRNYLKIPTDCYLPDPVLPQDDISITREGSGTIAALT